METIVCTSGQGSLMSTMSTTAVQEPTSPKLARGSQEDVVSLDPVAAALASAESWYVKTHPVSKEHHELAVKSLPGGNTRTLLHTSPFPLVMKRGEGSTVWDEDGHRYTDMVGELSAGIYGHSHPVIREIIVSTFDKVGMNLGSIIVQEQNYAALLCERFHLDRVRFGNSGTEANLHALNAAKAFTGKTKVVVFNGAYHGAVFTFGNGKVASNNIDKETWVIGKYNDVVSAKSVIEGTPDLAAVLVEGMQGAGGCIIGTKEFLQQIQVRNIKYSPNSYFFFFLSFFSLRKQEKIKKEKKTRVDNLF